LTDWSAYLLQNDQGLKEANPIAHDLQEVATKAVAAMRVARLCLMEYSAHAH